MLPRVALHPPVAKGMSHFSSLWREGAGLMSALDRSLRVVTPADRGTAENSTPSSEAGRDAARPL